MLDWLGDLGGLKEAIVIVLSFLYGVLSYNQFENFLVAKLYKFTKKDQNMDLEKYATNDPNINKTTDTKV